METTVREMMRAVTRAREAIWKQRGALIANAFYKDDDDLNQHLNQLDDAARNLKVQHGQELYEGPQ